LTVVTLAGSWLAEEFRNLFVQVILIGTWLMFQTERQ